MRLQLFDLGPLVRYTYLMLEDTPEYESVQT